VTASEWEDVENGETIHGPIETGHKKGVRAVIHSPDTTMFQLVEKTSLGIPSPKSKKTGDATY